MGGHFVGVQEKPHRIALVAKDAHCRHPGNRLNPLLDDRVGGVRDIVDALFSVRKMMGEESASAFSTVEGSASAGSCRRATLTLSRTSLAAASMGTPKSNSTRIELCPSREVLEITRIPATPLMLCSMGSVIWEEITSGLAPG